MTAPICCNQGADVDCRQGRKCQLRMSTDDLLVKQARLAIAEYNEETFGGGEPPYPQWAEDILKGVK